MEKGKKNIFLSVVVIERYEIFYFIFGGEFFYKLFWLKIFCSNLFFLGISLWTSNFLDLVIELDVFVFNWENYMGWKYCFNWVLFWRRYGKEI